MLIVSAASHPPIGHSDHSVIQFAIGVSSCSTSTSSIVSSNPRKYIWRNANFSEMSAYLSCVDWFSLCHNNPCALSLWSAYSELIHSVIDSFVPSYTAVQYTTNPTTSRKPRVPKYMRKCAVKKRRLWKKMRSSPGDIALQIKYSDCVNEWKRLLHQRI